MVLINPVSKVDIIISLSMEMITLDLDLFFASHFGPKRGILNSRNAMFGFLPQCPQHNSSGAYSVSEAGLGSQTAFTQGYWRTYICSSDGWTILWKSPAATLIALVGWVSGAANCSTKNWRSSTGPTDTVKFSWPYRWKLSKASFFHRKQLWDTQMFSLKSSFKVNAIL